MTAMKKDRIYMTRETRRHLVDRQRDFRSPFRSGGWIMEVHDDGEDQWMTIFDVRIELFEPPEDVVDDYALDTQRLFARKDGD